MKKEIIKTLIVGDTELECECENKSINELKLSDLGFKLDDLKPYELIVYVGKKGTKVLKSNYFRTGKIS